MPEHQKPNEGHGLGREQSRERRGQERKEDAGTAGHGLRSVVHLDPPLPLRGQQSHDGRLDERHHGHVRIGGNGNGPPKLLRRQTRGDVDGCGTVGAADDGDGTRLREVEAEHDRSDEGAEDADLGRGAQEGGEGTLEQAGEVGQSA